MEAGAALVGQQPAGFEPALRSGLFAANEIVCVGPPLLASAFRNRAWLMRLLPLPGVVDAVGVADGLNQTPGSGSNLINQALFLNSLANNGGPTQTISFAANSPLRNAGSNLGGLVTDQRGAGFPRVIDGTPDIGAFEFPVITVKNLNDSGAGSLRQAILDSNATTSLTETIVFQSGLTGTINLGSQLSISDDLDHHRAGAR